MAVDLHIIFEPTHPAIAYRQLMARDANRLTTVYDGQRLAPTATSASVEVPENALVRLELQDFDGRGRSSGTLTATFAATKCSPKLPRELSGITLIQVCETEESSESSSQSSQGSSTSSSSRSSASTSSNSSSSNSSSSQSSPSSNSSSSSSVGLSSSSSESSSQSSSSGSSSSQSSVSVSESSSSQSSSSSRSSQG